MPTRRAHTRHKTHAYALAAAALFASLLTAAPAGASAAEPPAHALAAVPNRPSAPPTDTLTGVDINPGLTAKIARAAGAGSELVLLAGSLMGDDGNPVAGSTVRADLEPNRASANGQEANVGALSLQLSSATTDEDGRFELRVPAVVDSFVGYVEDDGTASLQVSSFGPNHNLLYHLQVRPPQSAGTSWEWSGVDEKVLAPSTARLPGSAVRTSGLKSLRFTAHRVPQRAQRAAGINLGIACSHNAWTWRRADGIGDRARRWVNLQRLHTDNQIKAAYHWSNTSKLEIDAAANIGPNNSLVSAGYVRTQTMSAGVNFSVPAFSYKDAQVEFDYAPYHLHCMNPITGKFYYSGKFEWRPLVFTGGNELGVPYSAIFQCGEFITPISQPLWVARESTFTFANGASLFGSTLRSRHTNSSNHKLIYTPSSRTSICGKDNWPTLASQVREA